MTCMRDWLVAFGKSYADAILAIAWEYRTFAQTYPELYNAILKSPEMPHSAVIEAENGIVQILIRVMVPYHFSEEEAVHPMRGLRSLLHGFVSLEEAAFSEHHGTSKRVMNNSSPVFSAP